MSIVEAKKWLPEQIGSNPTKRSTPEEKFEKLDKDTLSRFESNDPRIIRQRPLTPIQLPSHKGRGVFNKRKAA